MGKNNEREELKDKEGKKIGYGRMKQGGKKGYLGFILLLIVVSVYNTYCKNKTVDFQSANRAVRKSAMWESRHVPGRLNLYSLISLGYVELVNHM